MGSICDIWRSCCFVETRHGEIRKEMRCDPDDGKAWNLQEGMLPKTNTLFILRLDRVGVCPVTYKTGFPGGGETT